MGRSPIGCIMVAGRVQQGSGKVINRLWEGCIMVAGRSPKRDVAATSLQLHFVCWGAVLTWPRARPGHYDTYPSLKCRH